MQQSVRRVYFLNLIKLNVAALFIYKAPKLPPSLPELHNAFHNSIATE
jgi:hypothetical protein